MSSQIKLKQHEKLNEHRVDRPEQGSKRPIHPRHPCVCQPLWARLPNRQATDDADGNRCNCCFFLSHVERPWGVACVYRRLSSTEKCVKIAHGGRLFPE